MADKEMVKCDWCKMDVEKSSTKFWPTGARLCDMCWNEADQKHKKMMEEFRKEMSKGTLNAGW